MNHSVERCELCGGTGRIAGRDSKGIGWTKPCECLEQQAQRKADEKRLTRGKEELNLCSIAIVDFGRGRRSKHHVRLAEWTKADGSIAGIDAFTAPEIGLPTDKDEDLKLVLEQLTWEQRCPARVYFEPADLIRRLGRNKGSGYTDTRKGIERLAALLIRQWSGWYDKGMPGKKKTKNIAGFHIIDSYYWPTQSDVRGGAEPQCWFSWGLPIIESMRKGAWKALDIGVYNRIKDSVARFTYRYAERSLHDKELHQESTEHFYRNILGLTWNDTSPATMVKVLKKHLAELPQVAQLGVRITPATIEFRRLK